MNHTPDKSCKLIDATQITELLGVSVRTVERLVDAGKLPPPVYVGRCKRWYEDQIIEAIRSLPQAHEAESETEEN